VAAWEQAGYGVVKADESAARMPEGEAAADRGERNETGKAIARGGKSSGKVPGAEEQR